MPGCSSAVAQHPDHGRAKHCTSCTASVCSRACHSALLIPDAQMACAPAASQHLARMNRSQPGLLAGAPDTTLGILAPPSSTTNMCVMCVVTQPPTPPPPPNAPCLAAQLSAVARPHQQPCSQQFHCQLRPLPGPAPAHASLLPSPKVLYTSTSTSQHQACQHQACQHQLSYMHVTLLLATGHWS